MYSELYADDRVLMMLSGASPSPLARHNRIRIRLDSSLSLTGLNNPLIFMVLVPSSYGIALDEFIY